MDIFDTALGDEVRRVINNAKGTGVYIDAKIHAKGVDVETLKVLNYDVLDDYVSNYTEEIRLSVLVPAGKVAHRIMPFKNELEVTITLVRTQFGTTVYETGNTPNFERFRAVLVESEDPSIQANGRDIRNEASMDMSDFEVLEFQLFRKAMEQFMLRSCGGIYRKTSKPDLIKTLLMQESSLIEVDQDYMPKGIDMVPTPDEAVREHIVIPHGTPVTDAVGYIHKNCGGVYPTGLSYYYKNDYWYVFPPYDYTRYQEADTNLVILQVPSSKLPSIENTFIVEGSVVTIVSTGDSSVQDQSEAVKLASGNGARFSNADNLFTAPAVVNGNKAVVSRSGNNNEFVSSQRKAGFNNVVTAAERITSNNMYVSSNLAAREGTTIQLMWENSNPSIIRPGMQAKFLYFKEGQVRELRGVVIGMQSAVLWTGKGLVQGRHTLKTAINLFVEPIARES